MTERERSAVVEMKKQLLVIDDDPGIRDSLSCAFEPCSHVWAVPTIAQGLEILRQDRIDLVVLDYCLSDGLGSQALRLIKTYWPSIPVIVITAYGSESLCAEFLRLGARDYFPKPYDLGSLMRVVKRLLAMPRSEARENVLSLLSSAGEAKGSDLPTGIQRALSFIHAHYTEPISLEQVAREAAMSESHFCRIFKATVGLGFYRYVTRLRIEKAKELLKSQRRTVAEVAFEVGFTDLSSFYRAFRLATGQKPGAWRPITRPRNFS